MTDLYTSGNTLLAGDMTDGDDILLLEGGDTLLMWDPVQFPQRVQLGGRRSSSWGTQITTTDSGEEVRNNRWSAPLRSYEFNMPPMLRTDDDYLALKALFLQAQGARYSFEFQDWTDDEYVNVRFDTSLPMTGLTPDIDHPGTINLIEVREYPVERTEPDPAPEYVASGTHVSQNSATLNLPYPSGIEADDIAIAQLVVNDALTGGGGWNTPAGWTLLDSENIVDNEGRHYLFWKRLTGAESGSVTFTTFGGMGGDASDNCSGRMSTFRGCVASGNPYDASETSPGAEDDTTPTAPNITAAGYNRLIVNFWAFKFPGTFAPGTLYTEHYEVSGTDGVDTGLAMTSREVFLPLTYAGETGSVTSPPLGLAHGCISVALKP